MVTVFVSCDDPGDAAELFSLLNLAGGASRACGGVTDIARDARFLLLPLTDGMIETETDCAAVLFADSCAVGALPPDCTVLCFCDEAAARCSGSSRQIISCGMHQKDTVTLSSLESGRPVLSVQRSITSFSGDAVEAGDFPLVTAEQNRRALIAAAVLLLLCGDPLSPESFAGL